MFNCKTLAASMGPKRHNPYWFDIHCVTSDRRVIACAVKATLFDGVCVCSLAPFLKSLAAPRHRDWRLSAELARHRPALTVVLKRLGHIFAKQFPMSRRQLRALGQKSTGKARDVLSCRTHGPIVLLSWFADERRSMKVKLSAQRLLQGFFTETADASRVLRCSTLLCRTRKLASN